MGNLGQAQNPSLLDYADGVDLAEFLQQPLGGNRIPLIPSF